MAEITILKTKAQIKEADQEQRVLNLVKRSHNAVVSVLLAEGLDLTNPKLANDLGIVNFFLKAAIEAQVGVDNEISDYMTKTGKMSQQEI